MGSPQAQNIMTIYLTDLGLPTNNSTLPCLHPYRMNFCLLTFFKSLWPRTVLPFLPQTNAHLGQAHSV